MQYYYGNNFNGTGTAAPSVISRTSGEKRSPREEPAEEMSESPQPDEVKAKRMKAKTRKEPKEKGTKKISKPFNPDGKRGPNKKKSEELQVKLNPGLTLPKETTFSSSVGYPFQPAILPSDIPPRELSQSTNHSAPLSHRHLASKLIPNIPPPGYFNKMPQAMAYSQDHEMYKRYYAQQYFQQNPNQQNPSQMNLNQMNPAQKPFPGQNPQNPAFMHQKPKETISPTLYQPPLPIQQKYLMNAEGQNPNYGAMHQHQREQREGTPSEETMDRGGLNSFMNNMKRMANNNSSYLSLNPAKRALNPQGPFIKMETPNEVTIQKNYVLMNPNKMGQMPPMNQMGGYPTENNKPMMGNQLNSMSNKNFDVRNPSEFPENMPKKNMPMSNINFQRGPPGMYPPPNGMIFDCKYEAPNNMNPNMGNLAMQQQAVKNYKGGYPPNPYGLNVNNMPNNPNQPLGMQFQESLNNVPPQQSKTTPKKTHNFDHIVGKKMEERPKFDPKQGLPNNSQIGFEKQNYPPSYAMMPNYQMQNYGPNQEYKPMLYNPNMKQFYMGYPPKPNQNIPTNQSMSENDTNDDNSFAQRQKLMKMPPQPQLMSKPQPPGPQNLYHQNMPNMNRQMGNANLPESFYKRIMMLNARKDGKEDVMSTGSDLLGKGMMKSGDDNDSHKKPMFNFDNEHMMKLFRKNKSDLGQEKKMNALLMELASNKKHYKEKKQKASKAAKEKTGKNGSKVSKSSMNESGKQAPALNINNDSSLNLPMNMSNFNNNPMNMNNFINNPMNINNSMNINNPLNMNPMGLKHSISTPINNNVHSSIINANGYPNSILNNKINNNNNFNNNFHNNNNNNINTNGMSPHHSYVSTHSININNANNNNDSILETNSLNNNKYNNYNNLNNQSNNSNFNNFNEETNENYKESPKDMLLPNNPIFNSTEQKVGVLSVEERKMKIEKYLKKKRKRTWNRKINYFCRKQVADKRLRLKGRFMKKPKQDSFSELDPIVF